MKCLCSGEQLRPDEMAPSSESLATKDYAVSGYTSNAGEIDQKPDTGNIEEAESSLRESGCLNYEVGFCRLLTFSLCFSQALIYFDFYDRLYGTLNLCCLYLSSIHNFTFFFRFYAKPLDFLGLLMLE